jgi:hypothetical protein
MSSEAVGRATLCRGIVMGGVPDPEAGNEVPTEQRAILGKN